VPAANAPAIFGRILSAHGTDIGFDAQARSAEDDELSSQKMSLPRSRIVFAATFFLCAIGLAVCAARCAQPASQAPAPSPSASPAPPSVPAPGGVDLDALGAKKLPDGPGKVIVETSCKDCHTFDRIAKAHHSLTRWRVVVRLMEQRGANVDPGDVDTLVQYLATNFGLTHARPKSQSPAPPHPAAQ
jgi:hypothetical protein